MMMLNYFLSDTGNVIANIGTLLPPFLALIGLVVWLARLESAVKDLRKDADEMHEVVDKHVKDNDAHVNQLHIGNLERRIGSLESSVREIGKEMATGHERINDKLDAKFDQLLTRINR